MRRLIAILLTLPSSACWGKGPSVVETFEETYLPYRQVGDDPQKPVMYVIRDDGNGKTQRLVPKAAALPAPHVLRWGVRYVVRVETVHNPTWTTSSRRVMEVLKEEPVLDFEFRLSSLSAPFFGADRRSFIDGQAFECQAPAVCEDIDAMIEKGEPFDLVMRFAPTPDVPPIAIRIDTPQ